MNIIIMKFNFRVSYNKTLKLLCIIYISVLVYIFFHVVSELLNHFRFVPLGRFLLSCASIGPATIGRFLFVLYLNKHSIVVFVPQ